VLVPLVTFLAMIGVVAELREEHRLRLFFAYEGMLWRIGKKDVPKLFKHYAAFRILHYLRFRPTAIAPSYAVTHSG
jgi:hypothetical protein